jgi:hypothetical protein
MRGRVGWRTATTRTSGNHSSACRYKTGASSRASVAPVSPGGSAPGSSSGTGGRCRRGPQPAIATQSGIASSHPARATSRRRVTSGAAAFRPEPPLLPEWLVEYPRRSSCESPVRRRTIPHRPCSSSHTTARDRHCRARPAPDRFSAIRSRSRRRRVRTLLCAARSAGASRNTSRGPRNPGDAGGVSHGRQGGRSGFCAPPPFARCSGVYF